MDAIGYIRSAVKDQSGEPLEKQAAEIAIYCQNKGLRLVQIFKDDGANGTNFNRQGWKDLNDYLHNNKGKIQSLVVSDLDRIGRDVIKTSDEIAHIEREYTIEVCSVKGRVNLKDLGQLLKPAQIAPLRRRSDKRLRK